MLIRRAISIGVLIFLNLMIVLYYNHQSRMTPVINISTNDNDLYKSGRSSIPLIGNSINDSDSLTNFTFVVDFTNETLKNNSDSEITLPVSFLFKLNPRDLCLVNVKNKITLLILVCSSVPNFKERQAIRETWGSVPVAQNNTGSVRVAFLLGKTTDSQLQHQVETEFSVRGDIIQQDFIDSYRNLTLKSIMLLQWVSDYCPRVHHVLKTDDDMYVHVPNLVKTLNNLPIKLNVIYGTLFKKAKPNRNPKAKWYVPKEQYEGSLFPDYLSGTGYVMSRDVVPKLLEASASLPFMVMEDVFITGLCAGQRRVKRFNVRGFAYWKRPATGCAFKDAITGHHVTIQDMMKIWKELQHSPLMCPLPKKPSKSKSRRSVAKFHQVGRK